MFIPIGDENPRERTPYVNYVLLGANILAFLLFCFPEPTKPFLEIYAMKPAVLDPKTLLTSMFLHANLMHLLGNMVFLWIFGDNVEDRLGHVGYAFFYLACGLAADFAHIATNAQSEIPTLGASGAISGVVGAYAVFFPRHRIRMLIWLGFFADIYRIRAIWWIGIWFLEQVFFSFQQLGGVAYGAHIGGFLAGVAVAGALRLVSGKATASPPPPLEPGEESRRPFGPSFDDPGIEFVEERPDSAYALLLLQHSPGAIYPISDAVAPVTGEDSREVAERLEATRGVVARGLPKPDAEHLRRELQAQGVAAALILDEAVNHPPPLAGVESLSWDDRVLRIRIGNTSGPVPWTAPFLFVAARVNGVDVVDFFVNRRTAFRVAEAPGVALTEVDPRERTEILTDVGGFARAVLARRTSAHLNEGVALLARRQDLGWLDFRDPADYDDYLFRVFNLTLSQVPMRRM
jgi:membrane associated rhomboid family serine protease